MDLVDQAINDLLETMDRLASGARSNVLFEDPEWWWKYCDAKEARINAQDQQLRHQGIEPGPSYRRVEPKQKTKQPSTMPDEPEDLSVTDEYKKAFNLGQIMGNADREYVGEMIQRSGNAAERLGYAAGLAEFDKNMQKDYHEKLANDFKDDGQKMTDKEVLEQYYAQMDGNGDALLENAIEKERAAQEKSHISNAVNDLFDTIKEKETEKPDPDRGPAAPAMPAPEPELTEEEDAERIRAIIDPPKYTPQPEPDPKTIYKHPLLDEKQKQALRDQEERQNLNQRIKDANAAGNQGDKTPRYMRLNNDKPLTPEESASTRKEVDKHNEKDQEKDRER